MWSGGTRDGGREGETPLEWHGRGLTEGGREGSALGARDGSALETDGGREGSALGTDRARH